MSAAPHQPSSADRSTFDARSSLEHLWRGLGLPETALSSVHLPGQVGPSLPSSYKIGILAQSSIALTGLLAALMHSRRNNDQTQTRQPPPQPPPQVTVPLEHAVIEFQSERLYTLDGQPPPSPWGPIGGLHQTRDGYVRVHDGFPVHRDGTRTLLGCSVDANRDEVAAKIRAWNAVELEEAAVDAGLAISALRSYAVWDATPHAQAVSDFPIQIRKLADGPPTGLPETVSSSSSSSSPGLPSALAGLRVVEMSRVIATPVAGRTLAAHGADVIWVTSPGLPDQPGLDRDMARGKRTVRLDMDNDTDRTALDALIESTDVFLQGFRPGSLASKGLSSEALVAARHDRGRGIICAKMSAYGPDGPWWNRRGFDSLVQTCSGMNVSEAEHRDLNEPARPTPCQALDHAGGYLLAAGIMAALYRQATVGGSYEVNVSLVGVMKYLRSLGQYPGDSGFQSSPVHAQEHVPVQYLEERQSAFGCLRFVKHATTIDGLDVGWKLMPKPLGSDPPVW